MVKTILDKTVVPGKAAVSLEKTMAFFQVLDQMPVNMLKYVIPFYYFNSKLDLFKNKSCVDLSLILLKWQKDYFSVLLARYSALDASTFNQAEPSLVVTEVLNNYITFQKTLDFYLERKFISFQSYTEYISHSNNKIIEFTQKTHDFSPEFLIGFLKKIMQTPYVNVAAVHCLRWVGEHKIVLSRSDVEAIVDNFGASLKSVISAEKENVDQIFRGLFDISFLVPVENSSLYDFLFNRLSQIIKESVDEKFSDLTFEKAKRIIYLLAIGINEFSQKIMRKDTTVSKEDILRIASFSGMALYLNREEPSFSQTIRNSFLSLNILIHGFIESKKPHEMKLFIQNFVSSFCRFNLLDPEAIRFLRMYISGNLTFLCQNPDVLASAIKQMALTFCNSWEPDRHVFFLNGKSTHVSTDGKVMFSTLNEDHTLIWDYRDGVSMFFIELLIPVLEKLPELQNHPDIQESFKKLMEFLHVKGPTLVLPYHVFGINNSFIESVVNPSKLNVCFKALIDNFHLFVTLWESTGSLTMVDFKRWVKDQLAELLKIGNVANFSAFYNKLKALSGDSVFGRELKPTLQEFDQESLFPLLPASGLPRPKPGTKEFIALLMHTWVAQVN
ncbi:MAG: hypothetical protein WC860_02845 [Candidatus Margulisiibacteriota bacterium]|jgi:hypothetical protein